MRQSDFAITQSLAQRAATAPVTAEEVAQMFQRRSLTGRAAEWWMDRRGYVLLYRGQTAETATILSPLARSEGVAASQELVARMRLAGLTDEEIAGYTAQWYDQPVPRAFTPPELAGQPLGAAGIPSTAIPGIAANFGEGGVVYVIRLPRSMAIKVPPWGLAAENEYVILNQLPEQAIIDVYPASRIPSLTVDDSGLLVPGVRPLGAADSLPGLFGFGSRPFSSLFRPNLFSAGIPDVLRSPWLPVVPPLLAQSLPRPPVPKPKPHDPPGAGTVEEHTLCLPGSSDELRPICTTQRIYIVKSGDTLWDLAQRFYGNPRQYQLIYTANKAMLGPDVDHMKMYAGQRLWIP
jgi:hypothetical protein